MVNVKGALPEHFPAQFTARLFSRVAISDSNECWEWTAGRVRAGYGAIDLPRSLTGGQKRQVPAHRIVCAIFHGPPPTPDHVARHACDNPPCCNPKHLSWGTSRENMADCVERGRIADNISRFNRSAANRGENQERSKLTPAQVMGIRTRLAAGASASAVAREFGVWPNTIRQIRDGKTWRHVGNEPWSCRSVL